MSLMIDTGASYSFVNAKCFKTNPELTFLHTKYSNFLLADGFTRFPVTGTVPLTIDIDDIQTNIQAFVAPNLCVDIILGMDYLLKYDLEIHLKKQIILFNFDGKKIPIAINKPTTTSLYIPLCQQIPTIPLLSMIPDRSPDISQLINHISDPNQYNELKSLLFKFQSTFDTSKYTIAKTNITHAIETYPHTPPVSKCYPSNPTGISDMRSIINKLLEADLIRPSQSPYAAPALLTKKKDNSWRLVVDYKRLNSFTIKDNHPLPNMEVTLQTLGGGYHFFSKLDLKSGFWQFPIDEKDRFKTAFITPFGLYEWNVLPQGLRNAPPSFQRIMNHVLSSSTDFCLVYLDDIIIYSRTYDEHLVHLHHVFSALQLHHLILTPTKCRIAQKIIEYLGHVIDSSTITPLPDKINSILLLPEPKTLAQANRFVGAFSWYRKFIPSFASEAAAIHAVTNLSKAHRHKFHWGLEQSQSFHSLKRLLTSIPLLLNFPDDTRPVLLSTDASKVGLGGALYQEINNIRKVLYYHSELLTSSQKRYHVIELEALAIFKCVTRMRSFLLGRNIIIYTDSCPLCHMVNKKISNQRVEKLSILLQEFNIQKIIHVQGKFNCLPDYLSRHPISNNDESLNSEYGLEFDKDKSSSIHLLGGVVTRFKSKLAPTTISPSPSSSKSLTKSSEMLLSDSSPSSFDKSSPPSPVSRESFRTPPPFDITQLIE